LKLIDYIRQKAVRIAAVLVAVCTRWVAEKIRTEHAEIIDCEIREYTGEMRILNTFLFAVPLEHKITEKRSQ
jgi:hypothetical protein